MRFPTVRGGLRYLLCVAATSAVAAGCGDEARRVAGVPDAEHASEVARNPYALTCGDLARQSRPAGTRLVIKVQAALTRERALSRRVAEQGFQRVNQSLYFGCSEEVRWLAARVGDNGGVVRLVTANVSGARPGEVAVRMDDAEVGLALRMRVPDVRSDDVRLHCAEVALGEGVGRRKVVDDGPGRFNPFGVSLEAAERRLGHGKRRCVRVASISG